MTDSLAEWLPVVGYEGLYEVSNKGHVRSLDRMVRSKNGVWTRRASRVLAACWKGPDRYPAIHLCRDGHVKQAYVHHVVLEAFAGPKPFPEAVSRHLNGDNQDCSAVNLAWGTQAENIADKFRHGTDHNSNKTHCPHDHPYSGDNLIVDAKGHRFCRACRDHHNRTKRKVSAA